MKQHDTIDWSRVHARLTQAEHALDAAVNPGPAAVREVHEQRARDCAMRRSAEPAAAEITVLALRVAEGSFGIQMDRVIEVGQLRGCTPLPGSDGAVCGVVAYGGNIRAVLDLASLLDGQPARRPATGYLLRVRAREGDRLLRVDQIEDIRVLQRTNLTAPEQLPNGPYTTAAIGVHRDGLVVLNLDALLPSAGAIGSIAYADPGTPSIAVAPEERGKPCAST